jgi:putative transposase
LKAKYAFMAAHQDDFRVTTMCRVLKAPRSGFCAWLTQPQSARELSDRRLLGKIKQSWLESGSVYGYRKVLRDMHELGEGCGKHRIYRLMRAEGLRAQVGYGRKPRPHGGTPSIVAPNLLNREFDVATPNTHWVTDITYIRTHEGWLYLATVMDLYSRKIVGWSMQGSLHADLVLQALLAAVWSRKPAPGLMLHSDQGTQYTSHDWQSFLKDHGIVCSMSRRGNCHDNAVIESFHQLIKRERIRRKIYVTRAAARSDVFDYIELFYNPKRRHGSAGDLSPVEFERRAGLSGR